MRRLGVIGIAVSLLVLGNCTKKGNGPEPEPTRYNIYLNVWDSGTILIIDADSLDVIDSIPGIGYVHGMTASPDGRWLYVQADSAKTAIGQLLKIDLRTKEVVARIPGSYLFDLSLVDSGDLIVRGSQWCAYGYGAELVDAHTLTWLGDFPDSLCPQSGPLSGTAVASKTMDGSNRVVRLEVATGEVSGTYTPALSSGGVLFPYRAVLHPNGNWVLLLGKRSSLQDAWFLIGDASADSTVYEKRLWYPLGHIAVSTDGRFIVVTDPGQQGLDPRVRMELYDLRTWAQTWFGGYGTIPAQVAFLPGSDRFVATKGTGGLGTNKTMVLLLSAAAAAFIDSATVASGQVGDLATGIRAGHPES